VLEGKRKSGPWKKAEKRKRQERSSRRGKLERPKEQENTGGRRKPTKRKVSNHQ